MPTCASRTSGLRVVFAVLALALVGCSPEATRDDTGPEQAHREQTIERLLAGNPAVAGAGYTVLSQDPLVVFFGTSHGYSADAYCGYEYAPYWTALLTAPLGGSPRDVVEVKEGWYWLCAG